MGQPTPEGIVLKAICEYLLLQERLGKCWFARINNGATYDPRRGVYRATTGKGYKAGCPDIIICLNGGRFYGCEVKSVTGRLSEEQKLLKNALEAVGGGYIVARGVQDVEHLFA